MLTEPAAEVIAGVAALQSERDTLLALLREVMTHEHLVNRLGESVILLPEDVARRATEAIR